ncbi:hypothetical protein HU200_050796 [Digitaria exilis]|uniref:Xyloglucan endotransglucosylase/hydrolase n=1 Tax=Digitaria exilis TaxID=1010633 RepID=A0A835AU04_9POAL|nr:hypothetical protein HU200_050796 [Digitaria exilis]CAB3488179.1 unnamed protein product [Digitaria exilis]
MAALSSCGPNKPWRSLLVLLAGVAVLLVGSVHLCAATLDEDIELIWGASHTYFFMDGDTETLALSLDEQQGSCFRSKGTYLYATISMDIKLVEGNSAGVVATVYTISEGPWSYHDEIDLEFLGNLTGEPITLHTNIFANGEGGREMQFYLWFDPTADYHTYTIEWNPKYIIIRVDGKAIRAFKNYQDQGVPYPTWQQQRVYGSLWDADQWATQGGAIKTDWSNAPFVAYYRNYNTTWCQPSPGVAWCGDEPRDSTHFDLDPQTMADLQWVDANYKIYDYCTDHKRFNESEFPKECYLQRAGV